jgi:hypothetical protein
MHYVRLKSANIEFTKEASCIPLPYHSSTPHAAADQLGASASGMASPTSTLSIAYRPSYRLDVVTC